MSHGGAAVPGAQRRTNEVSFECVELSQQMSAGVGNVVGNATVWKKKDLDKQSWRIAGCVH